jgi:hypothetical protein
MGAIPDARHALPAPGDRSCGQSGSGAGALPRGQFRTDPRGDGLCSRGVHVRRPPSQRAAAGPRRAHLGPRRRPVPAWHEPRAGADDPGRATGRTFPRGPRLDRLEPPDRLDAVPNWGEAVALRAFGARRRFAARDGGAVPIPFAPPRRAAAPGGHPDRTGRARVCQPSRRAAFAVGRPLLGGGGRPGGAGSAGRLAPVGRARAIRLPEHARGRAGAGPDHLGRLLFLERGAALPVGQRAIPPAPGPSPGTSRLRVRPRPDHGSRVLLSRLLVVPDRIVGTPERRALSVLLVLRSPRHPLLAQSSRSGASIPRPGGRHPRLAPRDPLVRRERGVLRDDLAAGVRRCS